jgi:hypothetical protein
MWENLSIIATQFRSKKQLKDFTHMFYLLIPCYKLYKEGVFSYVFTLKYMCYFGMNLVLCFLTYLLTYLPK